MQRPYSLFDNIITLHHSDGNPRLRPDPSEDMISQTSVNYMEECRGNHPALKLWKQKTGSFLAQYVLKRKDASYRKYILSSLPAGYALFLHKKGDPANPRTDAYLWGSSSGIFRSPAEFFFHAKWIMTGCPRSDSHYDKELWGEPMPEDFEDQCGCTYCAHTDQGYISRTYSNYTPSGKGRRN